MVATSQVICSQLLVKGLSVTLLKETMQRTDNKYLELKCIIWISK